MKKITIDTKKEREEFNDSLLKIIDQHLHFLVEDDDDSAYYVNKFLDCLRIKNHVLIDCIRDSDYLFQPKIILEYRIDELDKDCEIIDFTYNFGNLDAEEKHIMLVQAAEYCQGGNLC